MKTDFINSYNNDYKHRMGHNIKQCKFKDNTRECKINDNYRPAQALSFGGSIVSTLNKTSEKIADRFVENKAANNLIFAVNDNEAAFNAVYALLIAGVMKPLLILGQTGFDDKDGQLIATKNFLQAFIGSFLGFTVGGKLVKKAYDVMSNNLKLLKKEDNGEIGVVAADSKKARKIAQNVLKRENITAKDKWANGLEKAKEAQGLKKISAFLQGVQKVNYKPSEEELSKKAQELVQNLKDNHLHIFQKNKDFTLKLIQNIDDIELHPSSLRKGVKGMRSQPIDAFESFWKNSTGTITTVAKAMIASSMLPAVVALLFATKGAEATIKKANEKTNKDTTLDTSSTFKKEQEKYAPVANSSNISFKGANFDKVVDNFAKGVEACAMTKFGEGCTTALSKASKKPSARMGDVESWGLTLYWLLKTGFSKKIEKDQKFGFNAHTALVTVVSSVAALVVDGISDGLIAKAEKSYGKKINEGVQNLKNTKDVNKTSIEEITKELTNQCSKLYNKKGIVELLSNKDILTNDKELENAIEGLCYKYSKKLSKFKSLLIFTMVVRFLVPVLTVKSSKKLKKKLIEISENMARKKAANKAQSKQENIQTATKTQEAKKS